MQGFRKNASQSEAVAVWHGVERAGGAQRWRDQPEEQQLHPFKQLAAIFAARLH